MLSVQIIHDIPNSTISTTFSQFVALFIIPISQRSIVSRLNSKFCYMTIIKANVYKKRKKKPLKLMMVKNGLNKI